MNVAAWPRWVASYGVMPHVYIKTWSFGSNGTTAASRGVVEAHQPASTGAGSVLIPVNFGATRVL